MFKKVFVSLLICFAMLLAVPSRALAVSAPSWISAATGSYAQVNLSWSYAENSRSNQYHVSYGEGAIGQYGALNIGSDAGGSMRFTVGALKPGVRYCFAVSTVSGNEASAYSGVSCAYAGGTYQAQAVQPVVSQPVVGASTAYPKYQGTMQTDTGLNSPQETTGRLGVSEHNLRAVTGPANGQVTLFWNDSVAASNYHVVYTDQAGNWKWGVLHVGKTVSYTIGGLTPGVRYYFSLIPVRGEIAGPHSPSVSELAR